MSLFSQQLKKGKVGEELAYNYLIARGWEVEDVSNNEEYFSLDIDFLAARNGISTSIDVKTEAAMARTGNMFIEDEIIYKDGREAKGWLHYSKAEYIWHINPQNGMAFAYNLEEMREFIKKNYVRTAPCRDKHKTVKGKLVKPEVYKNSGYWYQEINLREIF